MRKRLYSSLAQGPVNLPPEAAGLRQALRKMHSYMWLEDAIADDGSAQAPGADTLWMTYTSCAWTARSSFARCHPVLSALMQRLHPLPAHSLELCRHVNVVDGPML